MGYFFTAPSFFLFFSSWDLTNAQRDSLSARNVNHDVVSTFALGGGRLFKPRKGEPKKEGAVKKRPAKERDYKPTKKVGM